MADFDRHHIPETEPNFRWGRLVVQQPIFVLFTERPSWRAKLFGGNNESLDQYVGNPNEYFVDGDHFNFAGRIAAERYGRFSYWTIEIRAETKRHGNFVSQLIR